MYRKRWAQTRYRTNDMNNLHKNKFASIIFIDSTLLNLIVSKCQPKQGQEEKVTAAVITILHDIIFLGLS